jgi:hypothetical protein
LLARAAAGPLVFSPAHAQSPVVYEADS